MLTKFRRRENRFESDTRVGEEFVCVCKRIRTKGMKKKKAVSISCRSWGSNAHHFHHWTEVIALSLLSPSFSLFFSCPTFFLSVLCRLFFVFSSVLGILFNFLCPSAETYGKTRTERFFLGSPSGTNLCCSTPVKDSTYLLSLTVISFPLLLLVLYFFCYPVGADRQSNDPAEGSRYSYPWAWSGIWSVVVVVHFVDIILSCCVSSVPPALFSPVATSVPSFTSYPTAWWSTFPIHCVCDSSFSCLYTIVSVSSCFMFPPNVLCVRIRYPNIPLCLSKSCFYFGCMRCFRFPFFHSIHYHFCTLSAFAFTYVLFLAFCFTSDTYLLKHRIGTWNQ